MDLDTLSVKDCTWIDIFHTSFNLPHRLPSSRNHHHRSHQSQELQYSQVPPQFKFKFSISGAEIATSVMDQSHLDPSP
jgi:hypothetical protein